MRASLGRPVWTNWLRVSIADNGYSFEKVGCNRMALREDMQIQADLRGGVGTRRLRDWTLSDVALLGE